MGLDGFQGQAAVADRDANGVSRAKSIILASESEIRVRQCDGKDHVRGIRGGRREERDAAHERHWCAARQESEFLVELNLVELGASRGPRRRVAGTPGRGGW